MTAALTLRDAILEDGPFLLAIRNEESVRSRSKSQEIISEETHRGWLGRHLHSADSVIWIIEREGEELGYVRAQRLEHPGETGNWLLSIALCLHCRAKGYGVWAVREACRLLHENFQAQAVIAEVLDGNAAALKLFQGTGFILSGRTPTEGNDFLRLELSFKR